MVPKFGFRKGRLFQAHVRSHLGQVYFIFKWPSNRYPSQVLSQICEKSFRQATVINFARPTVHQSRIVSETLINKIFFSMWLNSPLYILHFSFQFFKPLILSRFYFQVRVTFFTHRILAGWQRVFSAFLWERRPGDSDLHEINLPSETTRITITFFEDKSKSSGVAVLCFPLVLDRHF